MLGSDAMWEADGPWVKYGRAAQRGPRSGSTAGQYRRRLGLRRWAMQGSPRGLCFTRMELPG